MVSFIEIPGTLLIILCIHRVIGLRDCQSGKYGIDCSEECHCAPEKSECNRNGTCASGKCARGWIGKHCQTGCPEGNFGTDCKMTCHCPQGDECNKVNGLCSTMICEGGWTGAGCQTEMPRMSKSPVVTIEQDDNAKCYIRLFWNLWTPKSTNPLTISKYILEYSASGNPWVVIANLEHEDTKRDYEFIHRNIPVNSVLTYRITLMWQSDDKDMRSVPGPTSPAYACEGPTTIEVTEALTNPLMAEPLPTAECHCSAGCFSNGYCISGICFKGWTGAHCETECAEGTFGANCHLACHCPRSDTCNKVNGLCSSMKCAEGWIGAGCQTRMPRFNIPPETITARTDGTTCSLRVSWPPWSPEVDIYQNAANILISSYILEYSQNASVWLVITTIEQEADKSLYEFTHPHISYNSRVQYRIKLSWSSDDKFLQSEPGPHSLPYTCDMRSITTGTASTGDGHSVPLQYTTQPFIKTTPNDRTENLQDITHSSLIRFLSDPVVNEIGASTLNITIFPLSGEIPTLYEIIVEKLDGPHSGSTLQKDLNGSLTITFPETDGDAVHSSGIILTDHESAKNLGRSYYITGRILGENLEVYGYKLSVGSGEELGDSHYPNFPLSPETWYLMWVAAVNASSGTMHRTFARCQNPVITTHAAGILGSKQHVIAIVIGVVVCIILLAFLFVIAFIIWNKRRETRRQHYCYKDIASYHYGDTMADKYLGKNNVNNSNGIDKSKMYESCDPIELLTMHSSPISFSRPSKAMTSSANTTIKSLDSSCYVKKTNPILIKRLCNFLALKEKLDNYLVEEFQRLPDAYCDPVTYALDKQNYGLNRAIEVVPYDRNRIKLSPTRNSGSNYINASYVGTIDRDQYIVTQTPMSTTVTDFWQMVWEQNVGTIVMLMGLMEKGKPECEQYWPDRERISGDLLVELVHREVTAYYIIHDLKVSKIDSSGYSTTRAVVHYQFFAWTRGGIPLNALQFVDFVRRIQDERNKMLEVIVHCHAGGGRSGIYIGVDTLLTQGRQTGRVDVLRCVWKLRTERPNLVKTLKQYRFVHLCLAEAFEHPESRLTGEQFNFAFKNLLNVCASNKMSILAREFEDLRQHYSQDRQELADTISNISNNCSTVTNTSIFYSPKRKKRILLATKGFGPIPMQSQSECSRNSLENPDSECSMSADWCHQQLGPVYLDSFRQQNAFIIAQSPSGQEHLEDFWNLLIDNNVHCMVYISDGDHVSDKLLPESQIADFLPLHTDTSPNLGTPATPSVSAVTPRNQDHYHHLDQLPSSGTLTPTSPEEACLPTPDSDSTLTPSPGTTAADTLSAASDDLSTTQPTSRGGSERLYNIQCSKDFSAIRETSITFRRGEAIGDSRRHGWKLHNFQWHGWPADKPIPSLQSVMELLQKVREWRENHFPNSPLMVHSPQGVGRPAFFTLLWALCERLEDEWVVDVYNSAKFFANMVPRVISNLDQYRLLYRVMKEHIHRLEAEGFRHSVFSQEENFSQN